MKKQKICITGGLGYIGTQLCNLLSGEARYKDIIVLDNRFIAERVSQLRSWGIQFIEGSILDRELMKRVLADCDIVYHLAGITNVAYVATQANKEQDELIRSVGIDGTNNVLQCLTSACKLIFPSTHVVFEGLTETTFDIDESFPKCSILTYAKGKSTSERDIDTFHNNHVIVRLGSVYGYGGDTMRINIMPNLFSKIASQDGTIPLFAGGVQYKSLVNITDVVRAMKFLAEGEYTGTYHLSNENMTVAEVAQICKDINPKVTLLSTDDEIPNKGYTLSNKKLLETGFTFRYNIKDAIQEMISKWSHKEQPTDLEYIQKGGNEYKDQRGIIRNYELTEPINLIGWIESKAGTVRANHYHPIQEQKCLLIKGRYISVVKDLSYPDAPLEYKIIRPGDVAVIRPNVAHTMVFLEDSLFLNLVRGEREHHNYGITHTIPYVLVDELMRQQIIDTYGYTVKTDCRACGSRRLEKVLSLGDSPLANNLLDSPDDQCPMYPLELMKCSDCHNIQLSVVVSAPKMFDNYLYVSSTSPVFRQHFEQAADHYITTFGLDEHSVVWDIGSNDGIALLPLQQKGIRVCGIEPATNVAQIANDKGIPTIHGYFTQETATEAYHKVGSPDIVTASNVFAHADDLQGIAQAVFTNMKENGVFIIEVQYLVDTIKDLTFDNIYHEHVNYWSVTALNTFCNKLGYTLFHVEHIDTHGGSIRGYISRTPRPRDMSVAQFLSEEGMFGIHDIGTYTQFAQRVEQVRSNVQRNMATLRHIFPHIAAYGSPAKATTALNYYSITDIQYTIEDNDLKVGKFLPGVGIQIVPSGDMRIHENTIIIVLAWNFYDSIRAKVPEHIPCISIKDLQLPSIEFANLLSERYTSTPNIHLIDTQDFVYRLMVEDYWRTVYHQRSISIIPDCYNSMLTLIRTLPQHRYIMDIGANCGILSIPAGIMGYKVLAFDPAQANIDSLEYAAFINNIEDRLSVFHYALSDTTGQCTIYVPECPDNSAMNRDIAVAKMSSDTCTEESVRCITFDDWLVPGYSDISLIKIDTQGHELQVIRGMQNYLSNCHDVHILCEFDDSLGEQSTEIVDILTTCGFRELPPITNEDRLFYKS